MKRLVCLSLVIAMLLSIVACAAPEGTEQGTRPAGNQPGETDAYHADPGLPSVWYDGRTLTIAGLEVVERTNPARDIIYFEDKEADVINEAVHDRNIYVEETYGVQIEAMWANSTDMPGEVERAISAGLPNCQVMETNAGTLLPLIEQNYLADLSSVSQYLDLSQPWWNQDARKNWSLAGTLFAIPGDIMITDEMTTWAITFNRDLITEYNLESPYDVVDSYKWTYDKMYEMAAAVSDAESHEDGDYFNTTWGILSEHSNSNALWGGCGSYVLGKDDNDLPIVNELSESAYDAMLDIATMQFDKNVTLLQQNIKGVSSYFDGTIKIFQTGHGLFFVGSTTMIEWLREYDMDFGVLPLPMVNETQREYYSLAGSTALAIPKYMSYTQEDFDFISIVVQALGCESTATLLEAYYDKTLTYRGLRRPEDERMLDLTFDGRVYNLAGMYGWANAFYQEMTGATTEGKIKRLKSYFDSYANSIRKNIDTYLQKHGLS